MQYCRLSKAVEEILCNGENHGECYLFWLQSEGCSSKKDLPLCRSLENSEEGIQEGNKGRKTPLGTLDGHFNLHNVISRLSGECMNV